MLTGLLSNCADRANGEKDCKAVPFDDWKEAVIGDTENGIIKWLREDGHHFDTTCVNGWFKGPNKEIFRIQLLTGWSDNGEDTRTLLIFTRIVDDLPVRWPIVIPDADLQLARLITPGDIAARKQPQEAGEFIPKLSIIDALIRNEQEYCYYTQDDSLNHLSLSDAKELDLTMGVEAFGIPILQFDQDMDESIPEEILQQIRGKQINYKMLVKYCDIDYMVVDLRLLDDDIGQLGNLLTQDLNSSDIEYFALAPLSSMEPSDELFFGTGWLNGGELLAAIADTSDECSMESIASKTLELCVGAAIGSKIYLSREQAKTIQFMIVDAAENLKLKLPPARDRRENQINDYLEQVLQYSINIRQVVMDFHRMNIEQHKGADFNPLCENSSS